MRVLPFAVCLSSLWIAGSLQAAETVVDPALAEAFGGQVKPFLKTYCTHCHGGKEPKADLALDKYADLASAAKDRDVWERVLDNVREGLMPPDPETKPDQAERDVVANWIEKQFVEIDCGVKDPGRVTIRRLNRTEYNNTIRDLCGVDFHPADDFPADDVGYGFDNIGDVLSMPPILLEKYLDAAEQIVEKAIYVHGPEKTPLHRFDAADGEHEGGNKRGSGWAFPSSGQVYVDFKFPAPGLYALRGKAWGQQAGDEPARMEFRLNGKRIHVADVTAVDGDSKTYETQVRIGPGKNKKRFGLAFINDYYNPKAADPKQRDRNLFIDSLEIQGPLDGPPPPLPESHKRIIFAEPGKNNHKECAERVLKVFASRAFRRRATPDEVARLVKFVERAEKNGDSFERGIQVAMEAVLISPHFLFRVETDQEPNNPKAIHPINQFELAVRLSYFLWSSMPDDDLFRLAAQGKLHDPGVLESEVRRMLKDPKARALVENFAGQWLEIRRLKTMTPDPKLFPKFNEELRQAMLKETELFFASVMDDDRSVLDLVDADYTFLNEPLARHYGILGVTGPEFRRVKLEDADRGGLLTQASVLTVTSNPTRTSPVKRGKWILEELLNSPPPPPPPNVPELQEGGKALTGTLRERMEQHRANPSCASCHERMDSLGFGLENFDAVGAWRDRDGAYPIDASGTLPDGSSFKRPSELKQILKRRKDDFARCLTEKMLTYALGRGLEYYDKCAVDEIAAALAKNDYKFSTLILQIVGSDPFQLRRGKGPE